MKKFCFTTIIILITFFVLPENTKIELSKFLRQKIEKPIKSQFCILQKSEPAYSLIARPVPNTGCFINDKVLKEKINKGLPLWAKQQIREDLSNFTIIRSSELEEYFNKHLFNHDKLSKLNHPLVRFKITNGKVQFFTSIDQDTSFVYDGIYESIYFVLQYLAQNNYIPDTDFILVARDFVTAPSPPTVPIFTFAKDMNVLIEKNAILIPDWQNLCSINNFRERIRAARKRFPWKDKEAILFWRGGRFDSTGFREKLVSLSKQYPKLINAMFVDNQTVKLVDPEDHLKYKYLISIDGARCSWERLIWHLYSNSLTFKNQSTQIQWFYKGILPYVHYVPVQDEASLFSALEWANAHSIEVQSIINNASIFVDENLALEDMYHYIIVLLQEYTKKLKMD